MNTTTTITAEQPYHHLTPKNHPPPEAPIYSQKTLLRLLNTKCTTSLQHLKQTHALILRTGHFQDHYVSGSLAYSYANPDLETLDFSVRVFDQVRNPNVFVWNSLVRGFLDNNQPLNALSFYSTKMVGSRSKPNKYTYPLLLKACAVLGAVEEGVQVHAHVVKYGLSGGRHVRSAGVHMYVSFGRVLDAQNVLVGGPEPDVVCWNAMIDGFFKCGNVEEAKRVFDDMKEKNIGTWNTMVSGFASCGMIVEAAESFNRMPEKNDLSWSAMIDGYNRGGYYKESLAIFKEMQREKLKPSKFVLSSVLAACANLGALDQGRWIHRYIESESVPQGAILGTSLINMYAQCGLIDLAREFFDNMKQKEVFTWNAMIGGLAVNGCAEDAIQLFFQMQREKTKPDDITFAAILNACAHGGLVDKGLDFLHSMKRDYGVEPKVEHYGCVVDLLGRVGLLKESEEIINSMPIEPNAAVWGALLGACGKHGNVELGERVGKILLELEPRNSGRYALLSNIYAKAGRWKDVENLRKLMKERGVKTNTGKSLIDVDGTVHEFKMGDGSHPQMQARIKLSIDIAKHFLFLNRLKLNTSAIRKFTIFDR
ncbi:hypothetical protein RHSIM_Rhsim11G0096200 [Rhododendron simsii]|uniref:Pentatricopeptide repeat-containing protein n=1 Tax=Rhododendron simsii TaxID=118357 RepID=A0A834L859_RHOSS|nr:hypothetical protein RHSIM_Rhsim11G0096200 [Rhododendron simsii]